MTPPFDENWKADADRLWADGVHVARFISSDVEKSYARARLAAAAADMYRVLVDIEWSGAMYEDDGVASSCCPSCGAMAYPPLGAAYVHREGCALSDAIRRARGDL